MESLFSCKRDGPLTETKENTTDVPDQAVVGIPVLVRWCLPLASPKAGCTDSKAKVAYHYFVLLLLLLLLRRRTGFVMGNAQTAGESCASLIGSTSAKDLLTLVNSDEEPLVGVLEEMSGTEDAADFQSVPEGGTAANSQNHQAGSGSQNENQQPGDGDTSVAGENSGHRGHTRRSLIFKSQRLLEKVGHAFQSVGNAVGSKLHAAEDAMFPHKPQVGGSAVRHRPHPTIAVAPKVRGGVLLQGCHTDHEHKQTARLMVDRVRALTGERGLRKIGFEYRVCPYDSAEAVHDVGSGEEASGLEPADRTGEINVMTRLFHIDSNTMITQSNRKEYIADGDMYDAVARLCQEYAQDMMIREGELEWLTVCEAGNNPEPVRAMVSASIFHDEACLDNTPTLLIATGKGKVRAGVFSRQHLLVSGVECSSAVPLVREAKGRGMNLILFDPNVHGDRMGMITFEKSMARLFRRWESPEHTTSPPLEQKDLFVLSHSQSGAQLARYLLDKSEHYLPHIRAVAFTDSTHNIQWAKENENLHNLLESENCIYFKCSKEKRQSCTLEPLASVGNEIDADTFWQHRFGKIRTRCAGTSEHSLTNWFAHHLIWDHFDCFLHKRNASLKCNGNAVADS